VNLLRLVVRLAAVQAAVFLCIAIFLLTTLGDPGL